jgi:hypothetical protein
MWQHKYQHSVAPDELLKRSETIFLWSGESMHIHAPKAVVSPFNAGGLGMALPKNQ